MVESVYGEGWGEESPENTQQSAPGPLFISLGPQNKPTLQTQHISRLVFDLQSTPNQMATPIRIFWEGWRRGGGGGGNRVGHVFNIPPPQSFLPSSDSSPTLSVEFKKDGPWGSFCSFSIRYLPRELLTVSSIPVEAGGFYSTGGGNGGGRVLRNERSQAPPDASFCLIENNHLWPSAQEAFMLTTITGLQ